MCSVSTMQINVKSAWKFMLLTFVPYNRISQVTPSLPLSICFYLCYLSWRKCLPYFQISPDAKKHLFFSSLGCNHFYVVEKKWENFSVRKKIRCPWIIIMHMAFCEQKKAANKLCVPFGWIESAKSRSSDVISSLRILFKWKFVFI